MQSPLPLGVWMVQLTQHHHPDSRLLTDIPDLAARTNPESRDTSTITILEMALFPVYLREKIKWRVSPSSSSPFPPSYYPACRTLNQAAQLELWPGSSSDGVDSGCTAVSTPNLRCLFCSSPWQDFGTFPHFPFLRDTLSFFPTPSVCHMALLLQLLGSSIAAKYHSALQPYLAPSVAMSLCLQSHLTLT